MPKKQLTAAEMKAQHDKSTAIMAEASAKATKEVSGGGEGERAACLRGRRRRLRPEACGQQARDRDRVALMGDRVRGHDARRRT